MSDLCANCGSALSGPFCAQCGERLFSLHHLSFRHFIHEAVHEFTHLNGSLSNTLRLLFTRPGALAEAYISGKRDGLVRPLRLYLTVSLLVYFLAFRTGISLHEMLKSTGSAFAPAIAWGSRHQGMSEVAYLAQRNHVFQSLYQFSTLYVITILAMVLCQILWYRRHQPFGVHAVFCLYTFSATDILSTVSNWLGKVMGHPYLGNFVGMVLMFAYLVLAARRVHGESTVRASLKVAALTVAMAVLTGLATLVSLLIALPIFQAALAARH